MLEYLHAGILRLQQADALLSEAATCSAYAARFELAGRPAQRDLARRQSDAFTARASNLLAFNKGSQS